MKCLRCGKETEENQVFCAQCLANMEKDPVKPDTPIYIPIREERLPVKRSSFKTTSTKWENQVLRLRLSIVVLRFAVVLLVAIITLLICSMAGIMPQWFADLLEVMGLHAG